MNIARRMLIVSAAAALLAFNGCAGRREKAESGERDISYEHIGVTPGHENTADRPDASDRVNTGTAVGSSTVKEGNSINLQEVRPDESGRIMVVMFHNFVTQFTPGKGDDGQYTITFGDFSELLDRLYNKGYRLISMKQYLENSIDVGPGKIPIIFTFDDGSPGQFSLQAGSGNHAVSKESAVGIMEDFHRRHPDFGLAGVFYVNLGASTFHGGGTLGQRLEYLIGKGFEIGNHTLNHKNLSTARDADEVSREVGGNQGRMYQLVRGYKMQTLALPLGKTPGNLRNDVAKGSFGGVTYENLAIFEVGAEPAPSPVSARFNALSMPRVRAPGIKPVECDLNWWLRNLAREGQYISDGDPATVTVPASRAKNVDTGRLMGKRLRIY